MKRYYNNDNMNIDPSRLTWNQNTDMNKPINSINRIESDISVHNNQPFNHSSLNDHSSNTPFNGTSFNGTSFNNKPLLNQRNGDTINTFNEEMNRLKDITQEVFNKDKEIQELKNQIQQHKNEIDSLKKDKQSFTNNEIKIHILEEKLNEQYKLNKDLADSKHLIEKMKLEKEEDSKTVTLLKSIIRKIKKDEKENNVVYQNETLKLMLLKHNKELNDEKIHEIFIEQKITESTEITKELLLKILK